MLKTVDFASVEALQVSGQRAGGISRNPPPTTVGRGDRARGLERARHPRATAFSARRAAQREVQATRPTCWNRPIPASTGTLNFRHSIPHFLRSLDRARIATGRSSPGSSQIPPMTEAPSKTAERFKGPSSTTTFASVLGSPSGLCRRRVVALRASAPKPRRRRAQKTRKTSTKCREGKRSPDSAGWRSFARSTAGRGRPLDGLLGTRAVAPWTMRPGLRWLRGGGRRLRQAELERNAVPCSPRGNPRGQRGDPPRPPCMC